MLWRNRGAELSEAVMQARTKFLLTVLLIVLGIAGGSLLLIPQRVESPVTSDKDAALTSASRVTANFPPVPPSQLNLAEYEALRRASEEVAGVYVSNDFPSMLAYLRDRREFAPDQWNDQQLMRMWYEKYEWLFSSARIVNGDVTIHPVLLGGRTHEPATLAEKVNFMESVRLTELPFQRGPIASRKVFEVQVPFEFECHEDGELQRTRLGLVMEWNPTRQIWVPIGTRIYDLTLNRIVPALP
jgi:hypothetical protein